MLLTDRDSDQTVKCSDTVTTKNMSVGSLFTETEVVFEPAMLSSSYRELRSMAMTSALLPMSMVGLVLLFLAPAVVNAQNFLPSLRREPGATLKEYTGIRARSDSLRQVYYHDQTIAVVELGPGKELQNCELIEVYDDVKLALKAKNISRISRPIRITFPQMKQLMWQCQMIDAPPMARGRSLSQEPEENSVQAINPLSLFSGILPGTKWCGTGDIAESYFDIGESVDLDRCCRTHDLCPTKVRSFTSRYNLTNYSFYTKSHCSCDSMFYDCLKATRNPTANVMGNLYFNIVRVPCLEDIGCEGDQCQRKKKFRTSRKHY